MLIPIGHESTHLRSIPYVTFAFIGLCVLIFAAQSIKYTAEEDFKEQNLIFELYNLQQEADGELVLPPNITRYLEMITTAYGPSAELEEFYRDFGNQAYGDDELESEAAKKQKEKEDYDFYGTKEHEEAQGYYDDDYTENYDLARTYARQSSRSLPELQERADVISKELLQVSELLWLWRYGYVPKDMNLIGLVGYNFLHGGFWHLFGNILFIYLFGCLIEDRYGRLFFGVFYVLGGMFAGFAYGLMYAESKVVLIGASGSVFVILGGYLVKHWREKIRFLFFFGFRGRVFDMPAWVALPLIVSKELLFAYLMHATDPTGSRGGVAHWVHIWGFVFGAGVIFTLAKTGLEARFWPPLIDLDAPEESGALRHALKEERLGNTDAALGLLRKASRDNPDDIDLLQNYWRLARTMNRSQDMLIAGQKLMALDLDDKHPKMAHVRFGEILETDPKARLSPALLTRAAQALAQERYYLESEAFLRHAYGTIVTPSPNLLMPMVEVCATMQIPFGLEIAKALRKAEGFRDHEALDALEQKIQEGLRKGSPAMDDSISIMGGGESLQLADAHEFQDREAPPKNVHALRVFPAIPIKLSREQITLDVSGKQKEIPFNQVKMIAVGVIREPAAKPILMIDLIFDRPRDVLPQHRVLRLSSTTFNPLELLPRMKNPGEAFKRLIAGMLKASGADPAPSKEAVAGAPYTNYPNLRVFERDIYYDT